jgi:hypothetical protein
MKRLKQIPTALIVAVLALLCALMPAMAASSETGDPLTVGVPVDRCPVFSLLQQHQEL